MNETQTLPILVAPEKRRPPRNRRGAMRRKPRGRVKVACRRGSMGFGPNIALELQDVSQGGARVLCRDALPVGTEVELELMGLNHARAVKTLATVIRCESFGSAHSLAVQFEHQLGYPDLARMT